MEEQEFRLRILRVMALGATGIGLVSIVIDAAALILDDNWFLAGSGLAWTVELAILFWCWQQLNRGRIQAAANAFLLSGSVLISIVALLDTPSGVMVHLCIGCPFLILAAFGLTPSDQHTRWRIAISAVFPTALLLRQLWRPMEMFADTAEMFGAIFGGALGVFAMASLGQVLFSRLDDARKRSESDNAKLEVLNAQLAESRDRAVAADQAKAAFLAVMSHELRTPLNAIIGYTEMVREDLEDGTTPTLNDVEAVLGSGRKLLVMVGDILDFTALRDGEITLANASADLDDLARELATDGAAFANATGNRFKPEFGELGIMDVDRAKLRRTVDSLLSNAAKFTENGEIKLIMERESEGLRIRVSDTGVGMDPDRVEHLFQAFTQADSSYTRSHEGTGLGLAIVDRYVKAMGGSVDVKTAPENGSTFTLWIPQ